MGFRYCESAWSLTRGQEGVNERNKKKRTREREKEVGYLNKFKSVTINLNRVLLVEKY